MYANNLDSTLKNSWNELFANQETVNSAISRGSQPELKQRRTSTKYDSEQIISAE